MPRPARLTHSYKLTEEQKKEIAELYQSGLTGKQICGRFGIQPVEVYRVMRRLKLRVRTAWESQKRFPLNESAFNAIVEESAYWIGFLMADGSIRNPGKIRLRLARTDYRHIEKFKQFLKSDHKITYAHHHGGTPHVGITIPSKKLVGKLAEYGITENKTFTAKVIGLENNRHFWRGVIDGDGTMGQYVCYKKPEPFIGLVGARPLLNQFLEFAKPIVKNTKVQVRKKDHIFSVGFRCYKAIKLIKILYESCSIFLDRKQKLALKILNDSDRAKPAPIEGD